MTNAMLANVEVSPNRVNFCPHANALIDSGRIVADADVWGPAPARIRSPGGPGKVWLRRRFNADPIVHGGTNALLGA
jgi:hypothetical protein